MEGGGGPGGPGGGRRRESGSSKRARSDRSTQGGACAVFSSPCWVVGRGMEVRVTLGLPHARWLGQRLGASWSITCNSRALQLRGWGLHGVTVPGPSELA